MATRRSPELRDGWGRGRRRQVDAANDANIVAVASLLGIPAIVVAEGANVPEGTVEKAEEQGMAIALEPGSDLRERVAQLIALGV